MLRCLCSALLLEAPQLICVYLSRDCGRYCHSNDMMKIKFIMEPRPKTDDVIDLCTLVNKFLESFLLPCETKISRRMAKNDDVTDLCVSDFRYPAVVSLNGFAECGLELVTMLFSTVSDSYGVSCIESKTKQIFQYIRCYVTV